MGFRTRCTPVIPSLERLKQEDHCKCEASLGYTVNLRPAWTVARCCLKDENNRNGCVCYVLPLVLTCLWNQKWEHNSTQVCDGVNSETVFTTLMAWLTLEDKGLCWYTADHREAQAHSLSMAFAMHLLTVPPRVLCLPSASRFPPEVCSLEVPSAGCWWEGLSGHIYYVVLVLKDSRAGFII